MRQNFFAFVAMLAVASSFGCSCGNGPGTPDGEPDGGSDGGFDGGADAGCAAVGESCGSANPCCQGTHCINGVCNNSLPPPCTASGGQCTNNATCCTNRCEGNVCSSQLCVDNGGACSQHNQCCTGNCASNTCAPIPGSSATCKVTGQRCSLGEECCSSNCKDNVCSAQSWCKASYELCYNDGDCCERVCSQKDGGTAGFCIAPPGRCTMGGMPCTGPSNCCTRICADPGSGVTVCLPASGCVMTGLACTEEQECCGGGTNPNGTVVCDKLQSTDKYGRCDNGQSCNPVGNICGESIPGALPDGGTLDANASQNCCNGKKAVCKPDSSGIPRCFGGCPNDKCSTDCPEGYTGVAPCCINIGEECQFRDQCCDGAPCVPGDGGILRCSGLTCTPLYSRCTAGGMPCCEGVCLGDEGIEGSFCLPPGTFDGGTLPGTDGGTDGGSDAGSCELNGSTCSRPDECCSGICNVTCQAQNACKGQGESCTALQGDCCGNLWCDFSSGNTYGICINLG